MKPGGIRFSHIIIISCELHAIVVMLIVGSGLLDSKTPPAENRVDIVSIKDLSPPEAKLPPAQVPPKAELPETKGGLESVKAPTDPSVLNEKLEKADDSFTGMSVPTSGVSSSVGSSRSGMASGGGSDDNLDDYMPQYSITELPVISENDARSRIAYPTLAAKQGIEATVYLELFINSSGRIVHIDVLKDPGYGFADAAVKALLDMICTPAKMEGKPVAVRYRYPVHFRLM
jgi:TonB family protein